jgi:regulator of RNase E activity RraB
MVGRLVQFALVGLTGVGLASCAADDQSVDMAARDQIEQAGVDPAGELTYEHFFYFAEAAGAQGAAAELADQGFDVDTYEPDEAVVEWAVVAIRREALTDDEFEELVTALDALAGRHGGQYDGWGTPL